MLLTVGFAVLIQGLVATMSSAFGNDTVHRAAAEVVVRPDGAPGLSDAAVAAVPGAAVSTLASTVYAAPPGGRPTAVDAAGIDPRTAGQSWTLPGPGTMVVTAGAAAQFRWRAGDAVPLTFADGRTRPVRVDAVVDDASLARPVLLTRDEPRRHDPRR